MGLRASVLITLCGLLAIAPVAVQSQATVPQGGNTEIGQGVALSDVLQIGPVIEVMREEGIAYGQEMEDSMFPGQGGAGWQAMVAIIYDAPSMRERFDASFDATLVGSPEVDAIRDFFASDLGQRVLSLEIEARRAMLDPAVEEAATLAYEQMRASDDPRDQALQSFVEANDLIESNVMGAMNASLAFYRGLADVMGPEAAMPEDQMLDDVWSQEPDVRAETVDWLFPYLALAYKPLSDEDLAAYQVFSESVAGEALNAALFAAFDAVFVAVSRDLGRAAARQMQGQEL